MRALLYLRMSARAKGFRQATGWLIFIVSAAALHGGWIAAMIIASIFLPYYVVARYEVGKNMIDNATRRLLGEDRARRRPIKPPPPPSPP